MAGKLIADLHLALMTTNTVPMQPDGYWWRKNQAHSTMLKMFAFCVGSNRHVVPLDTFGIFLSIFLGYQHISVNQRNSLC